MQVDFIQDHIINLQERKNKDVQTIQYHFELDFDVVLPLGQTLYFHTSSLFEDLSTNDQKLDEIKFPSEFYENDNLLLKNLIKDEKLPINVKSRTENRKFKSVNGWWAFTCGIKSKIEQVFLEWTWAIRVKPTSTDDDLYGETSRQTYKNHLWSAIQHQKNITKQASSDKNLANQVDPKRNWIRQNSASLTRNFSMPYEPKFVDENMPLTEAEKRLKKMDEIYRKGLENNSGRKYTKIVIGK